MRRIYFLAAAMALAAIPAAANEPQAGTVIGEKSLPCGTELNKKRETVQLMCQEYVIRTDTTEYHVRQEKPVEKALIPVNTPIEFTMDKDKMKFKANGKKYEYLVVSETAITAAK
jgi:hypothetical protein